MESYFGGVWKDHNFEGYEYSGYQVVEHVNAQKPSSVLDIGCGYNRFRNCIPGLIGIDPYNSEAHLRLSLEDYYAYDFPPADIALCLGSINFGDEETIDSQIKMLDKLWLKECIFRVNPGIAHDWAEHDGITWYQWKKEKINSIASSYNYNLACLEEETSPQGHLRYYFRYTK
jgi:hypothetical protein